METWHMELYDEETLEAIDKHLETKRCARFLFDEGRIDRKTIARIMSDANLLLKQQHTFISNPFSRRGYETI